MSYKNHYVCTWTCGSLQFKHCDHMISFWSPPCTGAQKDWTYYIYRLVVAVCNHLFTVLKTEFSSSFSFLSLVLKCVTRPDGRWPYTVTHITIAMTYSFIHAINFLHSVEMSWENLSDTLWATALISVNSSSRLKHSANTYNIYQQ